MLFCPWIDEFHGPLWGKSCEHTHPHFPNYILRVAAVDSHPQGVSWRDLIRTMSAPLSRILTTQEIGSSSSMCNEYKTRGSGCGTWLVEGTIEKTQLWLAALGHLRRRLPKFKKWASSPHPRNCAAADQ